MQESITKLAYQTKHLKQFLTSSLQEVELSQCFNSTHTQQPTTPEEERHFARQGLIQHSRAQKMSKIVPELVLQNQVLKEKVALLISNYDQLKQKVDLIAQEKVTSSQVRSIGSRKDYQTFNISQNQSKQVISSNHITKSNPQFRNKSNDSKRGRKKINNEEDQQHLNPINFKGIKLSSKSSLRFKALSCSEKDTSMGVEKSSKQSKRSRAWIFNTGNQDDIALLNSPNEGMVQHYTTQIVRLQSLCTSFRQQLRNLKKDIKLVQNRNIILQDSNNTLQIQLTKSKQESQDLSSKLRIQLSQSQQKLLNQALIFDHHRQILQERVSTLLQDIKSCEEKIYQKDRQSIKKNSDRMYSHAHHFDLMTFEKGTSLQMQHQTLLDQNYTLIMKNQEYQKYTRKDSTIQHLWEVKNIQFENLMEILRIGKQETLRMQ